MINSLPTLLDAEKSRPKGGLKLLTLANREPSEKLPILISANDIRELVQYLKRRSPGVIVTEELDRARKRLFEENKLAAYQVLGITEIEDRLLKLSPAGWNLAKQLEPETQMFRYLLRRTPPYWTAVKWICKKNLDVLTSTDLLAFWEEFHAEAIDPGNIESMKGAAVSFFSLCQAAQLGFVWLGKRGHTTRLYVDHQELTKFIEFGSQATNSCAAQEAISDSDGVSFGDLEVVAATPWQIRVPLRVLLIESENEKLNDLIRRTLEIAQVESVSIDREQSGKGSLANNLHNYAHEYNALLLMLDEDAFSDDDTGEGRIKQRILMDIGAALVLFQFRVIVLGDRQFSPPEDIHDLIYYQFDKDTLAWDIGLRLINTIEQFKNEIRQSLS